jgi:pimeloyl-ACP methyl ester carboxylesterase
MTNVYFIPGMCVNGKVFDQIHLPVGYEKQYLEWHVPQENESLETYITIMARTIDTTQPFILVGYSLGAIIMQEMNHFLQPEKNIVISSVKDTEEMPPFIRLAGKSRVAQYIPKSLFMTNNTIAYFFARFIYDMSRKEIEQCVTHTSPAYMKWAINQITTWTPQRPCPNLYHIHGTKDQTFPYKRIKDAVLIEDGDHLMVIKKPEEVSKALSNILLSANQ